MNHCGQVDRPVCFCSEPDAGFVWFLSNYFLNSSETQSIKEVNEVANEGLYLENHWGFQRGQLVIVSVVF